MLWQENLQEVREVKNREEEQDKGEELEELEEEIKKHIFPQIQLQLSQDLL